MVTARVQSIPNYHHLVWFLSHSQYPYIESQYLTVVGHNSQLLWLKLCGETSCNSWHKMTSSSTIFLILSPILFSFSASLFQTYLQNCLLTATVSFSQVNYYLIINNMHPNHSHKLLVSITVTQPAFLQSQQETLSSCSGFLTILLVIWI